MRPQEMFDAVENRQLHESSALTSMTFADHPKCTEEERRRLLNRGTDNALKRRIEEAR